MEDRLLKPDLTQASEFGQKSFGSSGTTKTTTYKTADFMGSKAAPVKSYNSPTFLGVEEYGGKNQKFGTKDAVLSNKTDLNDPAQKYDTGKYDKSNATYTKGSESSKYSNAEYKSRTAIVEGKASKTGLDATGKALQDKIEKKELTIEQVRELLNKSR